MDHLFETRFSELLVTYGEKIALAIICLIVGKIVINLIIGAVGRVKYEGEENFVGDSEIIALGGASNETKDRPLG